MTNFVISLANPQAYVMLATTDTPKKIRLPNTITIARYHHQQIIHIQLNTHNRSILGRACASLYQNPLTHTINPAVPITKVHQTKKIIDRRSEKMSWALALLQDPETL